MFMTRMVCGVIFVMSCLLLSACGGMSYTDHAMQTTFRSFPHVPVGKALDAYFDDTDWEYRGEDKEINPNYKHLIVFTGTRNGEKEYIGFGSNDGKKYEVLLEVGGMTIPHALLDSDSNEIMDTNIWHALLDYRVPKGDKQSDTDKYITIVQKSPIKNCVHGDTRNLVGNMTIESAIKDILENDEWKAFDGSDGEKVVEVTGIVSNKDYDNAFAEGQIGNQMIVQFLLDDNNKTYGGMGSDSLELIIAAAIQIEHQSNSSTTAPLTANQPQVAPSNSKTTYSMKPKSPEQKLQEFHQNITNKNYQKAYICLSRDFQAAMPYDNWAAGFKNTVSSTVSDVNIESQSGGQTVLTYTLKAVDNPGGTQYFRGTATFIWTDSQGWKIDDITNKPM